MTTHPKHASEPCSQREPCQDGSCSRQRGTKGTDAVIDLLVIHCNSADPNEFIWYSLVVTHSSVSLQL